MHRQIASPASYEQSKYQTVIGLGIVLPFFARLPPGTDQALKVHLEFA